MATAPPLPGRTAANDKLIMATPYAQLTQRQIQYAQLYGLTLQPAPSDAPTYPTQPVFSPSPQKGAWMDPGSYTQGHTTFPDGHQVPGDATGTTTQADPAGTAEQRNALALIRQTLQQYGLPDSLADWAWSEIVAGKGMAEVLLDLQQRPEFKAEFPEIDARRAKNLTPLSPADIIAYRQQARQTMRAAGLPEGFYDGKDDFTNLLVNDVSINELTDRVQLARQASYQIPPEVATRLQSEFGITPGSGPLTAYFLDPGKALPLLQRDFSAAQIGGAADRTGYAGVSNDTARGLADLGVSADQAQQGFGDLASKRELFGALDAGETGIDQTTQLGAEFGGNAQAQQRILQRAARRRAAFADGGGYASSNRGLVGLGSADQG